ncbi:hypothetical protein [Pedobacter arcticus]|uniref:hypothetical protein n=1 Tax=Pedobacter arcticus TaxID=752140 RepID=UPI00035D8B54|nr:hypothetical protein [Pedobacter arcticus]
MERKINKRNLKSIEHFECNGDAVSSQSALLFKARSILKSIYLKYQLCYDEEISSGIEMPEDSFLLVLPRLESEGLTAAADFLTFSPAGICVNNVEGGYEHASREKLALLFIICNAELAKPLIRQFLVEDELKGIKKLSDLVNWISNMQNEKDVRRVLEREQPALAVRPQPLPLEEPLLSKKQLAAVLRISTKTIDRHPHQFKPTTLGCRNFYKHSECLNYKKPGG